MTELRRPALLDSRRHNREGSDSSEPGLDEWPRRYAGQNRRRDTAATWVITDAKAVVVGYATVAISGIDRSAAPEPLARGAPDPIPALLLGGLAVDRRDANLGIATSLAVHVLATAVELNQKAACRAVVVADPHPTRSPLVGTPRLSSLRSERDRSTRPVPPDLGDRGDATPIPIAGCRKAAT